MSIPNKLHLQRVVMEAGGCNYTCQMCLSLTLDVEKAGHVNASKRI